MSETRGLLDRAVSAARAGAERMSARKALSSERARLALTDRRTLAKSTNHPSHINPRGMRDARMLGDCADPMDRHLALLPAIMSSTKVIRGPLLAADAAEQFGESVTFSDVNVQSQGLITKLIAGGSVATPYLVRGICIAGRIRPYRYSLYGVALASDVAGGHIPEVLVPGGIPEDATALPATFDFNTQGIVAYDLFLRSYQFQYLLQGRWLMVNERAIDIGVADSKTAPKGFGDGKFDPSGDIQHANETFRTNISRNFAQTNCTTADAEGTPTAPTLVDLQFVQPKAPGVYGCCYPIRPHVLWPLQTYQMFFERTSMAGLEHDELLSAVTSQSTLELPDPSWPDSVAAGANGPAVFLGTLPMNFFELELGLLLRGAEFFPVDAIEWMMRFGFPWAGMWLSDPTFAQGLSAIASQAGVGHLISYARPLAPGEALDLGGMGGMVGMLSGHDSATHIKPSTNASAYDKRERLSIMLEALKAKDAGGGVHGLARAAAMLGQNPNAPALDSDAGGPGALGPLARRSGSRA